MKATYQILTVIFWLAIVYAAFILIQMLSHNKLPNNGAAASGRIIGSSLGVAVLPTLIYIIRSSFGAGLKFNYSLQRHKPDAQYASFNFQQ